MKKAIRIIVRGKVQGVWFRASAKKEADLLGLKGFVMNYPDGSVYMEATGGEKQLKAFIAWCRQGPPQAAVSSLQVDDVEPGNFQEFKIVSSI